MALSGLSFAALPVWGGFLSKEYLLQGLVDFSATNWLAWVGLFGVMVGGTAFVWLTCALVHKSMPRTDSRVNGRRTDPHHSPAPAMVAGPLALTLIGFCLPFILNGPLHGLVEGTVSAITDHPYAVHVHLWEGINTVFLLSIGTFVVGVGLYLFGNGSSIAIPQFVGRVPTGEAILEWTLTRFNRVASWVTHGLQDLSLTSHLSVVLGAAVFIVALVANQFETLFEVQYMQLDNLRSVALWLEGTVLLISLIATLTVLTSSNRLAPVIALSVVWIERYLVFRPLCRS